MFNKGTKNLAVSWTGEKNYRPTLEGGLGTRWWTKWHKYVEMMRLDILGRVHLTGLGAYWNGGSHH